MASITKGTRVRLKKADPGARTNAEVGDEGIASADSYDTIGWGEAVNVLWDKYDARTPSMLVECLEVIE